MSQRYDHPMNRLGGEGIPTGSANDSSIGRPLLPGRSRMGKNAVHSVWTTCPRCRTSTGSLGRQNSGLSRNSVPSISARKDEGFESLWNRPWQQTGSNLGCDLVGRRRVPGSGVASLVSVGLRFKQIACYLLVKQCSTVRLRITEATKNVVQ